MGRSSTEWLSALPERRTEGLAELVHGSPRDPLWEYVTSVDVARANLAHVAAPIGLHGHTHIPMAYVEAEGGKVEAIRGRPGTLLELGGRRALVNPGSVGQPRDGDPLASYLILDPDEGTVAWHRVGYDIAAVQQSMREAGLPGSLIARLAHGL
jgi:diadenosine tetraphosphatase ApaH/serine/threonine PP2A family protein phosphatase